MWNFYPEMARIPALESKGWTYFQSVNATKLSSFQEAHKVSLTLISISRRPHTENQDPIRESGFPIRETGSPIWETDDGDF